MNHSTQRRQFIKTCLAGITGAAPGHSAHDTRPLAVPPHLLGREDQFRASPRQAALAWFRDAKFGLFIHYGPIAGIWLDGIAVPVSGDRQKFRCQELYDKIHRLQPHALVSFKFGVTGTEDFCAPEQQQLQRIEPGGTKPIELCESLNPGWGYVKTETHRDADWVMQRLAFTREKQMNYLLNLGPLPDGSVLLADRATLQEVGRRRRVELSR